MGEARRSSLQDPGEASEVGRVWEMLKRQGESAARKGGLVRTSYRVRV